MQHSCVKGDRFHTRFVSFYAGEGSHRGRWRGAVLLISCVQLSFCVRLPFCVIWDRLCGVSVSFYAGSGLRWLHSELHPDYEIALLLLLLRGVKNVTLLWDSVPFLAAQTPLSLPPPPTPPSAVPIWFLFFLTICLFTPPPPRRGRPWALRRCPARPSRSPLW